MINKSVFEDDLIQGMQRELQAHDKKQGMDNLVKAADHLHSALIILEEAGLTVQANKVFGILKKFAEDDQAAKHKQPTDTHTKGLTSEKMLNNLKHHGTVFNMADDGQDANSADDFLNLDISDKSLEVNENDPSFDKTFEDSD